MPATEEDDQTPIPQCAVCLYEGKLTDATAIYSLATCSAKIQICNEHTPTFAGWAGKVTSLKKTTDA